MNRSALLTAVLLATWGCLERHSNDQSSSATRCTSCHGDANAQDAELWHSAPPNDLFGNTRSEYPGVGSHTIHLVGSGTHAPVPCSECHQVPQETHEPGHMDSDRPAEVVFGALATHGGREPSYEPSRRGCSNTYCHGEGHALWTRPRSSIEACGSCHGLPPAPPHPQSTSCPVCHENVREDRSFIRPELHVDGRVQVIEPTCSSCHGTRANSAPPPDTLGNTPIAASGVGAHARHLNAEGPFQPIECEACHRVPARSFEVGHIDPLPAEILFSGVATRQSRQPVYDGTEQTCSDSWCHTPGASRASSPPWTAERDPLPCSGCHGMPPDLPHPQMTNCQLCHAEVVGPDSEIIDPLRHVDGTVDAIDLESLECNACHGGATSAPPFDLQGASDTSAAGVGAHAIHLQGSETARAVACAECHRVPDAVRAPGHLDDSPPAEVVFSGVARAFGAQPSYSAGVCANTFCHGDSFVAKHASGGTVTRPSWTRVDGTQARCGACHALPPPQPHPSNADDCSACHENVDSNLRILHPKSHVDGQVTFWVPPSLRSESTPP